MLLALPLDVLRLVIAHVFVFTRIVLRFVCKKFYDLEELQDPKFGSSKFAVAVSTTAYLAACNFNVPLLEWISKFPYQFETTSEMDRASECGSGGECLTAIRWIKDYRYRKYKREDPHITAFLKYNIQWGNSWLVANVFKKHPETTEAIARRVSGKQSAAKRKLIVID